MIERRNFPRKRRRLIVEYVLDGKPFSGFTWDMSYTGLYIAGTATPRIGERMSASIHLPDGKRVACEGKVIRSRKVPASLALEYPNGFSVALTGYFEDYCRFVGGLQ